MKKNPAPLFYLALAAYAMLFGRDLAGGAIRYYAETLGVPWLWFIPDIAAAAFIVLSVTGGILGSQPRLALVHPLFWGFYGLLGYEVSDSAASVESAFKMVLPLIFGLHAGAYKDRLLQQSKLHWAFFGVAVFGILIAKQTQFPWTNYVFAENGIVRQAANQRWMGGAAGLDIDRLSGFAADNTLAGLTIALSALVLMLQSGFIVGTLVFAVSLWPLYLTTSRTALVAVIVGYVALLAIDLKRAAVLRIAFWVSVAAMITAVTLMPLMLDGISNDDVATGLTSMVDRIRNTWVDPWDFVSEHYPWAFITGLGLGPVGYPTVFSSYSMGQLEILDNFALTNYLMFGIPGLAIGYKMFSSAARHLPPRHLVAAIVIIFTGTVVQGYGGSLYCLFFGLIFSASPKTYAVRTARNMAAEHSIF